MDVTPQELRGSEIKEAWRGYHRDEVDELLERAAVTIENLGQQLATASSRPAPEQAAAAVPVNRDDAEMLQRTLLLAQRAADDAVNEAQAQARKLIEDSEARAQALVGEAEASARRIAESERRRLESEIQDLASRRDMLQADADALEEYASAYRDRVRAAIEADLDRLGSGAIDAPGARPELHEVDVPAPGPAFAAASPAAPDRTPMPDAGSEFDQSAFAEANADDAESDRVFDQASVDRDDRAPDDDRYGTDTRAITIDSSSSGARAAESMPSSSPIAAPPRPAEPEWPPPAPQAGAPGAPMASSSWLAAGDDWALADTSLDDAPPWEQSTAVHEPFSSELPMEATSVDSDALDDDAFFASLRDAVRDDEPLGPRDEAPAPFFDDELADDRRRFRRRR
ncbi:MAG TPA: DivIVA domain-containing protein [Acidimicrobiia bacterium]|nr:DivIVA domain-containing protein [Acidimicrobiia bacterium]